MAMIFLIKIFSIFVLSICAEIGNENIIINALLSTDGTPEQQSIFTLKKMKEIKLSGKYGFNKVALVDDEDFEYLNSFNWTAANPYNNKYYATRSICINSTRKLFKTKGILMHRLIMGISEKKIWLIDHIDGNGLNNQKSNLRICTSAQNATNRFSSRNSTSRFLGVSFCKQTKKWRAVISPNNNQISLGRYKSEEDAAMAYNEAAKKYHGEFANLNKI